MLIEQVYSVDKQRSHNAHVNTLRVVKTSHNNPSNAFVSPSVTPRTDATVIHAFCHASRKVANEKCFKYNCPFTTKNT